MTTMSPEIIYMLKVNGGIALFYAFYKLFCGRDTLFRWRRTALLSFLALSFLYPLLSIEAWVKEQPSISELANYYATFITADSFADIPQQAIATTTALPTPSLMNLLVWVYLAGVLALSIRFIVQLLSIFRLVLKCKEETIDGIRVRSLTMPVNPFSFFKWIFVYLPTLKEDEKQEILMHEQTHVCQWHSIDVIAGEIVTIICWMNPFIWLLKTEIRLNLEYLADNTVIESVDDARQYQYHLLGLANQNRQTGLYNNFNLSHLKNRIIMMNKKRTRMTGRIKYALFAPLAAALLLVSNIEAVARTAERITDEVIEVTKPEMSETNVPEVKAVDQDDNQVFQVVEEMPEYPDGGLPGCLEFLGKNIKYPAQSIAKKEEGRVIIQFIVEKDGSLSNLNIVKKVSPELDQEASRVIGLMPKWKPGKQRGQVVRVKYTVPITFKLPNNVAANTPTTPAKPDKSDYGPDANGTYKVVEEMPEYPNGGLPGCLNYIKENVKYPAESKQKGITGKVIVQFIVEKDGSITSPKVVRSVNAEMDKEAIRVVQEMPKWNPGKNKGEAVRCKYSIPIAFQ